MAVTGEMLTLFLITSAIILGIILYMTILMARNSQPGTNKYGPNLFGNAQSKPFGDAHGVVPSPQMPQSPAMEVPQQSHEETPQNPQ